MGKFDRIHFWGNDYMKLQKPSTSYMVFILVFKFDQWWFQRSVKLVHSSATLHQRPDTMRGMCSNGDMLQWATSNSWISLIRKEWPSFDLEANLKLLQSLHSYLSITVWIYLLSRVLKTLSPFIIISIIEFILKQYLQAWD